MDWLTFISTDIKSLVWPAVAIIALLALKNELRGVVPTLANRLQSFKGFGVETTFSEGVDQVEQLLPAPEAEEITRLEDNAAQRIETFSAYHTAPLHRDLFFSRCRRIARRRFAGEVRVEGFGAVGAALRFVKPLVCGKSMKVSSGLRARWQDWQPDSNQNP